MVSQTISLPECRLASTTTSLEATLRSSLTLDLEGIPPTVDSPATQLHTFDDLVRAKEVNDLWIQRVGGTRLVFSLSGLGGGTNNDNHGCLVASWIEGHPSLHQLGITLVRIEDGEGTGTEGMPMSFSVGHADMASCMVAPRGAPVAGLRCVTCYVGLSVIDSIEGQDGSASRRKKRVKRRHAVTDVSSTRGIVEAALGLLLHGSGRRYAGFSVSGRSLGLKALAPGVFDYVHLMVCLVLSHGVQS